MNIELSQIELAAERLKPILHHTELDLSSTFSAMTGGRVYLKCENRQKTGSFKIRGASNKIAAMIERGEKCSVVASSAGNHAQGVAYAAQVAGVKATVVMPTTTPLMKVNHTKQYGAEVILYGGVFDDAAEYAMQLAEEKEVAYVNVAEAVTDETGKLPEDATADGVHLQPSSCKIWLEYLKTHTIEGMNG